MTPAADVRRCGGSEPVSAGRRWLPTMDEKTLNLWRQIENSRRQGKKLLRPSVAPTPR